MAAGILIYCPGCSRLNPPRNEVCSNQRCQHPLKSLRVKTYYIEYRDGGRRIREMIGASTNQQEAKQRLAERLIQVHQGTYIEKAKTNMPLKGFRDWYLGLSQVRLKKSHNRDVQAFRNLVRILGPATKLKDLSRLKAELFRTRRLEEPSGQRSNAKTAVASVNRELRVLVHALNLAVENRILNENPLRGLKMLPERNERERILSPEEANRLVSVSPPHIQSIILFALNTGMRESEILGLCWSEINFRDGVIRLSGHRTKSGEGRTIPMFPVIVKLLKRFPRAIHTDNIFLYNGKPIGSIKKAFATACKKSKIENLWFHDLRRTFITEMAKASYPERLIMAITGHKTRVAFDRYRRVREDEVMNVRWEGYPLEVIFQQWTVNGQ